MKPPLITRIETFEFKVNLRNISGSSSGLGLIYTPGDQGTVGRSAMRIETDAGVSGEAAGQMIMAVRQADLVARFLIGRDARQRNEICRDLLFELRQHDALAIGLIDICLWDLAGKLYDAPVYELLGGRRRPLRAYASTYHGDRVGGLDSPRAIGQSEVPGRSASDSASGTPTQSSTVGKMSTQLMLASTTAPSGRSGPAMMWGMAAESSYMHILPQRPLPPSISPWSEV